MAGPDHTKGKTAVVGLPGVEKTHGVAAARDAHITEHTKDVEVDRIVNRTTEGQGVEMVDKVIQVPRTVMKTEQVEVPDVHIESRTVEKPVTVVKQVPETVRDVEERHETVTREEIVIDKKKVQVPAVQQRELDVEKPTLHVHQVIVPRPNEIMRDVKVVRPEIVTEKVRVQRPVQKKRTYKITRPETVTKKVLVREPVQRKETVTIEQPELREAHMTIQVPHKERQTVAYEKPITLIKPAEGAAVIATGDSEADSRIESHLPTVSGADNAAVGDYSTVPVGLPFTEIQEKEKTFTVTTLEDQDTLIRETWMQPVAYEKVGYEFEEREVEVTYTEMREEEYTVVETVLEDQEVDVEVSVMKEVMEKWPVTKERREAVTTSDVTLETVHKTVPELTTRTKTVEVPRKVTHEEDIVKRVPVEREVLVDRAVTEMQRVEVQVPVEGTKMIDVERPTQVYENVTIQVPKETHTNVSVQKVQAGHREVTEQDVEYSTKHTHYTKAKPAVVATPIGQTGYIQEDTVMTHADLIDKAAVSDRSKDVDWNVEKVRTSERVVDPANVAVHVNVKNAGHKVAGTDHQYTKTSVHTERVSDTKADKHTTSYTTYDEKPSPKERVDRIRHQGKVGGSRKAE